MVAYNGCKRLDVKVTFVALYPGTFIVGRENHFLVNQVKKREGVPRYRAVHAAELGCHHVLVFQLPGGLCFLCPGTHGGHKLKYVHDVLYSIIDDYRTRC